MSLTLHSLLKALCHLCAVMAVWLAVQATPAAEPVKKEFDLPADVAARSLKQFARQSGVQVLISADLGRETRTRSVKGLFTPREALDRMLAETGLTVREDAKNGTMAVLLSPRPNESDETPAAPTSRKKTSAQATWKT
ncbi:MAG: STN domain-containing protein [Opitutaceae bacterium]|nr:STN domain-containing protein [Opitutaceae bacterium]